jgi:hypothetical protein
MAMHTHSGNAGRRRSDASTIIIFLYVFILNHLGECNGPEGPGPSRGPNDRYLRNVEVDNDHNVLKDNDYPYPDATGQVCVYLHHLLPEWFRVPGHVKYGDPNFPSPVFSP